MRYGDASYEDDMYLQFALQQSLLDANAGGGGGGGQRQGQGGLAESSPDLDYELQRAISESLRMSGNMGGGGGAVDPIPVLSDDFAHALEISRRDEEDRLKRLRDQEEEELRQAIALSLNEM